MLSITERNAEESALRRSSETLFLNDGITAEGIHAESGAREFYTCDEYGSPVRYTDENGNTTGLFGYEEYGLRTDLFAEAETRTYGTTGCNAVSDPFFETSGSRNRNENRQRNGNIHRPFTFTGYMEDEVSGLYFAQAREYDPVNGRFAGKDWVKGFAGRPYTLNEYGYCWNNPLMFVDLNGLTPGWLVALDQGREAHSLLQAYEKGLHPDGTIDANVSIKGASTQGKGTGTYGFADLTYFNGSTTEIYEIKPVSYETNSFLSTLAHMQLNTYVAKNSANGNPSEPGISLINEINGVVLQSQKYEGLTYTYKASAADKGMIYYSKNQNDTGGEPVTVKDPVAVKEKETEKEKGAVREVIPSAGSEELGQALTVGIVVEIILTCIDRASSLLNPASWSGIWVDDMFEPISRDGSCNIA